MSLPGPSGCFQHAPGVHFHQLPRVVRIAGRPLRRSEHQRTGHQNLGRRVRGCRAAGRPGSIPGSASAPRPSRTPVASTNAANWALVTSVSSIQNPPTSTSCSGRVAEVRMLVGRPHPERPARNPHHPRRCWAVRTGFGAERRFSRGCRLRHSLRAVQPRADLGVADRGTEADAHRENQDHDPLPARPLGGSGLCRRCAGAVDSFAWQSARVEEVMTMGSRDSTTKLTRIMINQVARSGSMNRTIESRWHGPTPECCPAIG